MSMDISNTFQNLPNFLTLPQAMRVPSAALHAHRSAFLSQAVKRRLWQRCLRAPGWFCRCCCLGKPLSRLTFSCTERGARCLGLTFQPSGFVKSPRIHATHFKSSFLSIQFVLFYSFHSAFLSPCQFYDDPTCSNIEGLR